MINFPMLERVFAVVGGIIVGGVAAHALRVDWKTPGLDNAIFKLMLALLALGGVIAMLAGLNVLGNFGKA